MSFNLIIGLMNIFTAMALIVIGATDTGVGMFLADINFAFGAINFACFFFGDYT